MQLPGSTTSMTFTSAVITTSTSATISTRITSSTVPSITLFLSPTPSGATPQLLSRWTLLMSLLTIIMIIKIVSDDSINM